LDASADGVDAHCRNNGVLQRLERKISAAAQQRIGPDFMGPFGLLAPVADGLKLFKEDVVPAKADSLLFTLGPIIVVIPVFLVLFDCAVWTEPGNH